MFTEATLVSTKDSEGRSIGHPAICVWIDADLKEKKALLDYLRQFGPMGQAAALILLSKDPRIFLTSYKDEFTEELTGRDMTAEAVEHLKEKYEVKY